MSEQSQVRRKASLVAAAAVTIEGLEARSLFSASVTDAVLAVTPTPKVFQGEVVQADFSAATAVNTWTITWGDGTTSHLPGSRSHATHQYVDTGIYAATIAGGTASAGLSFKIVNTPPDVAITTAPATGYEGTAISLDSSVTDAGDAAQRVYGWTVYRDGKHFIVPDGTDITSPTFAFTPNDIGLYVARLTVLDGQGGSTTRRSTPIDVANAAPTGTITGTPHRTVDDGRTVYLAAAASDPGVNDTISYNWTLLKDGVAVVLDHPAAPSQAFDNLADGSYEAVCTVTDNYGAATVLAPAAFDVATTLPPTSVSIGGVPPGGDEGTAVNAYATSFGPNASGDETYAWSVTKNGSPFVLPGGTDTASSSFNFTPDDNGEFVVKVIASDDNGVFGQSTTAITVANVAPTVTISGQPGATIDEGSAVALSTTLTDPGLLDGHWYQWAITKDGQPWTPPQDTRLDGSGLLFTPDDNGVYVATVTVHDLDNGQSSTPSQPITVRNVAPVAAITGAPATSDEGTPITLGSHVTDAGSADTEAYAWSVTKNGQPYAMASTTDLSSATFTFLPNDNGTYVATLTVTDKDGGQDTVQSDTIAVANVAPVGIISGVSSANEGDAVTLNAYGSDVGTADTLSYTWHATRGGQPFALDASVAANAELDFTPTLPGDYVFSVAIRDDDNGVTQIDHTLSVANVAPLVSVAGPGANAGQGDTLTYHGAATDPGSETLTYAWSVKRDGVSYTMADGVSTDGATLSFTADDAGNYVTYLTVSDGVGGVSTSSSGVTTVVGLLAA